jgi:hypothetical protein
MASSSSTFVGLGSPTATQVNGWSQGTLGYSPVTANQTGIAGAPTDLTNFTVTITVVAGRRLRIEGHAQCLTVTAPAAFFIAVQEGSTVLGRIGIGPGLATGERFDADGSTIITPTAGTHTYKLTATRFGGTGTLSVEHDTTNPGFILVEDIGAV